MKRGSYYGLIMILLFVVALIISGCGGSSRKDNEPTEYVKVVYDGTTYMFTSGMIPEGETPSGIRLGIWLEIFGSDSPLDNYYLELPNNGCLIRIVEAGTGIYNENVEVSCILHGVTFNITDLALTLIKCETVGGEIIGEFNGMIETKSITGSFKVKHSKDIIDK